MVRNRLLLVCAAILGVGTWIAWRSVLNVEAGATVAPSIASSAAAEPSASLTSILDDLHEAAPSERAPVTVVPRADPGPSVLAAGIVVDDRGTPVRSADVYVCADRDGPAEHASGEPRRLAETKSDASGRFEIRGTETELHLNVRARRWGFFDSDPVPFERGAADLRLELPRGGVVAGRVLVDAGIPAESLRVQVRSSGEQVPRRHSEILWKDGKFAFANVVAHSVEVSVCVNGQDSPIVEIDSVQVPRIGMTQDPRLDPLDLRGTLGFLTIDVEDDAGRSCSDATVVLGDPGGRFKDVGGFTRGGRVQFLVPKTPYDVDVYRTGWRKAHVSGVQADQVVRLKRGMPVRVILDGTGALPPAPYRLAVGLFLEVRPPRPYDDGMGSFTEGRATTFIASSPGPHEVAWYIESGARQTFLFGMPHTIVELRDSDEEQQVHVDLPDKLPAAWEAAIQRLEEEGDVRHPKAEFFR
jgi:hypothetical protein